MRIRVLRRSVAQSVLLLLLSVGSWDHVAAQSCRPAGDTTNAIIRRLTYWITVTDPAKVSLRDTKFKIPVVPTSQLVVATDPKVCTKAAQVYAAQFARSASPSVFTIQMGSGGSLYYAVYDPAADYHELSTVLIFDKRWNRYGGYTW